MKHKKNSQKIVTLGLVLLSVVLAFTFAMDASVTDYAILKMKIGEVTGMEDSVLHAYFGLMIFAITALVLNQPFRARRSWILVFVVALLNEVIDLINAFPHFNDKLIANCLSDVLFTVVFPFTLVFIAKLKHSLDSYQSKGAVGIVMKSEASRRARYITQSRLPES